MFYSQTDWWPLSCDDDKYHLMTINTTASLCLQSIILLAQWLRLSIMSGMHKNKSSSSNSGLVYSTDLGRMCPTCGKAIAACICKQAKAVPGIVPGSKSKDNIVRISRETKGRGGKSVNVISGLALAPAELENLCTQLKKRCGTGGTVKEGAIEIQGEHRDTLVAELSKRGYTVKKAGG